MNERQSDFELLREFVRKGRQSAFATLTRRHLDLVYATALRKVEDSGAAEEIAQNVFSVLARKSWQFASDDSLPAWLHRTALLESKTWLRGELRRRRREQTAAELGTTMKTPDEQPALRALAPLLDEALLSLREKDRVALLLRYYESQSLREVGASLGVREDAAQKRVASALEQIAKFFQRRGFRAASVAATAALLQQTTVSASASTASVVVNAVLQNAPAFSGLTALLARAASLSKAQVAAACLLIAVLPIGWRWKQHDAAVHQVRQIQVHLDAARAEQTSLESEIERSQRTAARLESLLVTQREAVERNAKAAEKFDAWKTRIRNLMLAGDYRWPDDSPFVRIPKSAAQELEVSVPVVPPGVIVPATRELLGLTSAERLAAEESLSSYMSTMNRLVEARLFETNHLLQGEIPDSAIATKIFEMPALGDEAKENVKRMLKATKEILGEERGGAVELDLDTESYSDVDHVMNFKAIKRRQQAVAFIYGGDLPEVFFQWQDEKGSMGSGGMPLTNFLASASPEFAKMAKENLEREFFPAPVTSRLQEWLQQQAEKFVGEEAKR